MAEVWVEGLLGNTFLFAGDFVPLHCIECNGQSLPYSSNVPLASVLGYSSGDDEGNFQIPDYSSLAPTGFKYLMIAVGIYPVRPGIPDPDTPKQTDFSGQVIEINNSNFEEFITENSSVVVLFRAAWSGPSKQILPIFEEMADEMRETRFVTYDIDQSYSITSKYGIRLIPTICIFRDSMDVAKKTGFLPRDTLRSWLKNHVG